MPNGERPVIAIVPARGGSKGVPRKNLRRIGGRPLVEIAIRAALDASKVDHVYLSSDDDEILTVGRTLGAELIRRPDEFASDTASAVDVVQHFLKILPEVLSRRDPYIVYLQPTSPLRSASHIDQALSAMAKHRTHTLTSVIELAKSPFKSFSIDACGRLRSLFDESLANVRRQDLPTAYMPNGAIYIFRVSDFLERGGFPSNGSLPFVMRECDSIDIDSEEEIIAAEGILEKKIG